MRVFDPTIQYGRSCSPAVPTSIRLAIDITKSMLPPNKKSVYLSGAVTTGCVFETFVRSGCDEDSARRNAVGINVRSFKTAHSILSACFPEEHFINPGEFHNPGWGQAEYLFMWTTIIIERVKEVRVLDDWEHSNGAVSEVICALSHNIPVYEVVGGEQIATDNFLSRVQPVCTALCSSPYDAIAQSGDTLSELTSLYRDLMGED